MGDANGARLRRRDESDWTRIWSGGGADREVSDRDGDTMAASVENCVVAMPCYTMVSWVVRRYVCSAGSGK